MERGRVLTKIGWTLRMTMETRVHGENWWNKYEGILEELWNKFELVHSTTQVAFWDITSNQVKSGEGSFHETKGKRKEFNENKHVMIERKNRYFKKRVVVTKCEVCKKTHTGMCYLKLVLVVDMTILDVNWGTTQNNGESAIIFDIRNEGMYYLK